MGVLVGLNLMVNCLEEYLEAVYELVNEKGLAKTIEVAKKLKVNCSTATEMIQSLEKHGYVSNTPYRGTTLTQKGLNRALALKRKHRLLEVFLADILRIPKEKVHEEASKLTNCISEEIADALCKFLNHPTESPDGKDILRCNNAYD